MLVAVPALVLIAMEGTAPAQRMPRTMNRPARPERGRKLSGTNVPKLQKDQPISRLENMSPEERRAALDALPPERRQKLENRLSRLQKLSPDQRVQLEERLQRFKNMSPEQQQQVRHVALRIQQLPDHRKAAVRRELKTLRGLPEAERQSRLQSSSWKKQFSPEEQEILRESSALLPEEP